MQFPTPLTIHQPSILSPDSFYDLLISSLSPVPPILINSFMNQWTPDRLKQAAKDNLVFQAMGNSCLSGLLIGSPVEGGVATIFWVLVYPEYQRQGIGGALLQKATEFYKRQGYHNQGCHKLRLMAPSQEAVEYYKHRGFTQEGFHPHHWFGHNFWSLGKIIDDTRKGETND